MIQLKQANCLLHLVGHYALAAVEHLQRCFAACNNKISLQLQVVVLYFAIKWLEM